MAHIVGYSASTVSSPLSRRYITNTYGTTLNTIDPELSLIVTQTAWPETTNISHYNNGYIAIELDNLVFDQYYDVSFKITNITNNPLNATFQNLGLGVPSGTRRGPTEIRDNVLIYKNLCFTQRQQYPNEMDFDLRICGMSFTLSEFMVTPSDTNDGIYEPYQGSTTDYEFGVLGKNKFNGTIVNQNIGSNGKILTTDLYRLSSLYVPVSSGTYTLSSAENYPTAVYVYKEDNDDSFITNESLINWNESPVTFTINEGKYVSIKWKKEDGSQMAVSDISNIQLELGTTATAYEPYDPNKTVYGGWVDLVSGEVCEEDYHIIVDGVNVKCNRDYSNTSFITAGVVYLVPDGQKDVHYRRMGLNVYCDNIPMYGGADDSPTDVLPFAKSANSGSQFIRFYVANTEDHPELDTAQKKIDFVNEYLAEHPANIVYKLATPNTYHIAPTVLQTFLSHNNVWSNADYVEVEYDLHETQSILARKQFIVANQPHIVKPAAAPLQNFVTDMAAPVKECKVYFGPVQDLHGYEKPWVGGSGKNLLNVSADNRIGTISTVTETETGFNVSDTNVNGGYLVEVKPNTTYTYSYTSTYNGGSMHGRVWAFAEKPDSSTAMSASSLLVNKTSWTGYETFTTDENTNWIVAGVYAYGNGLNSSLTNMQVEEGSTATAYEPYENICLISGWTGMRVYHSGKNILPITDTRVQNQQQIDFPGGILSFSAKTPNEDRSPQFVIHNNDGLQVVYWTMTGKENGVNYRDNISAPGMPKYRINASAYDAQAELGETHTEYEPFKGSVNIIDWTEEAETVYGGYVDLVNGELVQTHCMAVIDEHTTIVQERVSHGVKTEIYNLPYTGTNENAIFTNGYGIRQRSSASWNYPTALKLYLYPDDTNVTSVVFGIPDVNMTQAEWVDWLSKHEPIQIYYKLLNPTHYSLSPTQLKTLRGTNNIWSNANGNIELSYWKH